MEANLELRVEAQRPTIKSRSLVQPARRLFCITCCISAVLAGTLCQVRSVSFLHLPGLITVQAVPSCHRGCKTAQAISPELLCHLRIGFLFSLCSRRSGGVVTRRAVPRTNRAPDRSELSGENTHAHLSMHTYPDVMCTCVRRLSWACRLFIAKL